MAAVIGALRADLSASIAEFEADMGKAAEAVQEFGRKTAAVAKSMEKTGQALSKAITAPFLLLAGLSARAAMDASKTMSLVEAKLQSMGAASGRTAEQLEESAKKLQRLSTFDSGDILKQVTNNMLNFGRVSGVVFDRAQRASVDMAASMNKSLGSTSVTVGKALNDPIKGIKALAAEGIKFNADQIALIKKFAETNDVAKAQNVILGELERRFKGAGAAARGTGADLQDAWREFQENVGKVVVRVLDVIEPFLVKVLDLFNKLSPGMQTAVVAIGAVAAAVGPLLIAAAMVANAIAALAPAWAAFVSLFEGAMLAAGISSVSVAIQALVVALGPWIAVIGVAVVAAWRFRDAVVQAFQAVASFAMQTFWPALQELGKAIVGLFQGKTMGVIGSFVRFVGWALAELLGLFVRIMGTGIAAVLTGLVRGLTTAVKVIDNLFNILGKILTGDFAGALDATVKLVTDFVSGVLSMFEAILPGITAVVVAVYEQVKQWIGDGLASVLDFIQARFPGLVSALASTAQGAVAWAKNIYDGIKGWINDNLGPVIEWAKDRIRELNALFGWITRRQASLTEGKAPAAAPAAAARPPAPTPPPAGTGLGGGGGGKGRKGKSDAEKAAEKIAKATEAFKEALKDNNDAIDKAFGRYNLPRSIQQANALRLQMANAADTARKAGVDMTAFAAQMAVAEQRIKEFEIEGLVKEARAFAREVRDLSDDIDDFAGGLPPLDDQLRGIDRSFENLRQEILDQIEENKALADSNDDAKAAMVRLEAQLGRLDKAHASATDAANAQYRAEKNLADLEVAKQNAETMNDVRDLAQRASGKAMSGAQAELRRVEDDLLARRRENAIALASLESELTAAKLKGDTDQIARLQSQIAAQTELGDLVNSVTALQLVGADRVRAAWEGFAASMESTLTDMVANWTFDLDGLRNVFKDLAKQLFIKPFMESAVSGVGDFLKGFGGFHAEGGRIPSGKWGIVGEDGPEKIYGGAGGVGVLSNEDSFANNGGGMVANFYVKTPDANSFRLSQRQMARQAKNVFGG